MAYEVPRDQYGNRLETYDRSTNDTRDKSNNTIGTGNLLVALLK